MHCVRKVIFLFQYKLSTGWRVKDGERVYKAFRNGKPIVASGREGYALSLADNKSSKGNKRKRRTDNEYTAPSYADKSGREKPVTVAARNATDNKRNIDNYKAPVSQPSQKDLKSWFQGDAK